MILFTNLFYKIIKFLVRGLITINFVTFRQQVLNEVTVKVWIANEATAHAYIRNKMRDIDDWTYKEQKLTIMDTISLSCK